MPRSIPEPPESWTPPEPPGGREFKIELITPLFGGGVITRENDISFPFRPTSIRGQLEFWWRATGGKMSNSLQQLRQEQSKIWGNTEQASQVQIVVEGATAGPPMACARYETDPKNPGKYKSMPTWDSQFQNASYALFPFQGQRGQGGTKIDVQPASCILKGSFVLRIQCPDKLWPEVEQALWVWANFGGLGSRTRRGCGAIRCPTLAPKDRQELVNRLKPFVRNTPTQPWPIFAKTILIGPEESNALSAWSKVIQLLRDFRQGVNIGRNPGEIPNRPGRSRWPEPETIRRVTKKRHAKHARMQHIPDDAFPRAELGLPIVFHFKDPGEPEDTVLYPGPDGKGNKRERMASPLILRPVALQNGKFVPVVVQLAVPALDGVDLRKGNSSLPLPFQPVISGKKLAEYRDSPLAGRSPNGSALEGFLAFARSKQYLEVTP